MLLLNVLSEIPSGLWDLNLVDPNNRRPVDFKKRKSFLMGIM